MDEPAPTCSAVASVAGLEKRFRGDKRCLEVLCAYEVSCRARGPAAPWPGQLAAGHVAAEASEVVLASAVRAEGLADFGDETVRVLRG